MSGTRPTKIVPAGMVSPIFSLDAKLAERRFIAAFFAAQPKPRSRHRIAADEFCGPGAISIRWFAHRNVNMKCEIFASFRRRPKMRLRMSKRYHIAVVGATGAVGVEMFRVLERRGFPVASIRAFSSKRSAGKSALFHGEKIPVAELARDSFRGIDLALFSAGTAVAREFAPIARDAGAIVIDNSSTFRMEPDVPLVIPEINGDDAKLHRGIIANPNCTTAVALDGDLSVASRFPRATCFSPPVIRQSLAAARARSPSWNEQVRAAAEIVRRAQKFIRILSPSMFSRTSMYFLDDGYTKEEMKMQNEGRKYHASS